MIQTRITKLYVEYIRGNFIAAYNMLIRQV
jgi:hypothetical protein